MLTVKEMVLIGPGYDTTWLYDATIGSFTYDKCNGYITFGGHDGSGESFVFKYSVKSSEAESTIETLRTLFLKNSNIKRLDDEIIKNIGKEGINAVDIQ